jgi:hypothetical protein
VNRRHVAVALLFAMLVGACGIAGDHQLYVVNESETTWIVRALNVSGANRGFYSSAVVMPGADGVGLVWFGPIDTPLEVLTTDCVQVGALSTTDGEWLQLSAAPGLRARITPPGADRPRTNTPEIMRPVLDVPPDGPCLSEFDRGQILP